jgi:hypothetical protein
VAKKFGRRSTTVVTKLTKNATVKANRTFTFSFRPDTAATGRLTFAARIGRRNRSLGSKRVNAPAGRVFAARMKLTKKNFAALRKAKRLKVTVTFALTPSSSRRSATFTLRAPKR